MSNIAANLFKWKTHRFADLNQGSNLKISCCNKHFHFNKWMENGINALKNAYKLDAAWERSFSSSSNTQTFKPTGPSPSKVEHCWTFQSDGRQVRRRRSQLLPAVKRCRFTGVHREQRHRECGVSWLMRLLLLNNCVRYISFTFKIN